MLKPLCCSLAYFVIALAMPAMSAEPCAELGNELIEVKIVPGKGHAEVPEFFKDQDLMEFIIKQAKEKNNEAVRIQDEVETRL